MFRIRDGFRVPGRVRVVYFLLFVNILGWIAQVMAFRQGQIEVAGGIIPAEFTGHDLGFALVGMRRVPALVSVFWHMFIHGGFFHLFSNMIFLYLLGPNVEARMGSGRFSLFYLSCGAVGALCHVIVNSDSVVPMIGASGAISGLLGAYLVWFGDHYIRITIGKGYNYRDYPIPVKALLAYWFLSQFLMWIIPTGGSANTVAIFSHIGGFITGFFLCMVWGGRGRPQTPKFNVFDGGRSKGPYGVD